METFWLAAIWILLICKGNHLFDSARGYLNTWVLLRLKKSTLSLILGALVLVLGLSRPYIVSVQHLKRLRLRTRSAHPQSPSLAGTLNPSMGQRTILTSRLKVMESSQSFITIRSILASRLDKGLLTTQKRRSRSAKWRIGSITADLFRKRMSRCRQRSKKMTHILISSKIRMLFMRAHLLSSQGVVPTTIFAQFLTPSKSRKEVLLR